MRARATVRIVVGLGLFGLTGCGDRTVQPTGSGLVSESAETRSETPSASVGRFRLVPSSIRLEPEDFGAQLRVEAIGDGPAVEPDALGRLRWSAEPAGVVAVDAGYVRAVGAGKAVLTGTSDRSKATVEVEVTPAEGRRWSFAEGVMPILTRAGCNTGGCHGRADGQNGFHLSLFGYDPAGDRAGLVRQDAGRKLSAFDPASSLFLRKATGEVPHVGGPRIAIGSPEYAILLRWIGDGAPVADGAGHGALAAVRVEPPEVRLDGPGSTQLRVLARYADGFERDVTRQAITKSNDESVATIDPRGRATLARRGEGDLIVRFGSKVASVRIGSPINPDLRFDFAARARANAVDDRLFARLETLKVPPSPSAPDATYLRRATLDLTGQQPRPEQVREFLADADPAKRAKLVDRLLKERDFVRFWAIKLGDLLEITSARPELAGTAGLYQNWVENQLTENRPWDQVVRALLTTVGDPSRREAAAANYALESADPKEQAERTAQRFLGLRLRCAQCHDHPFDVWTQDDYFGLAAIFAKVGRSGGMMGPGSGMMMNARPEIRVIPAGTIDHPRTRQPAEARLLGGGAITPSQAVDPRTPLVDWIVGEANPYFARMMANWTWAQLFGRGLVDPPDDLSASNPPVHPTVLDALARDFADQKYDLRALIRTIATSEAYGMATATVPGNEADTRLFSHQAPRPLSAHQMADALAQATGVVNRFKDRSTGTRAVEVSDPATASTILETFGRCSRVSGCAGVSTPALSLRQSLLVIGGDLVESKVSHANGYLANLLELDPPAEEVVENLYLRTLCRFPTGEERSHWLAELKAAPALREAAQDLFWSLLNSREFAFNH